MNNDEVSAEDNVRVKEAAKDFQDRVPDSALWYDSDVLGTFPDGWSITVLVGGRFISGRVASVEQWVAAMGVRRSPSQCGGRVDSANTD
jgi:hypothetical protein